MPRRPTARDLRGPGIVQAPARMDVSSGAIASGRSLERLGAAFMRSQQATLQEIERQAVETAQERGAKVGNEATTTLANGREVPIALLSEENTVASRAYNESVISAYKNRVDSTLRETFSELEQAHIADPSGFEASARSWWESFRGTMPPELRATYDNRFSHLVTLGRAGQIRDHVRQQADATRGSNIAAIEGIFGSVDRIGRDLSSPNADTQAAALAGIADARASLIEKLEQAGPTGMPIYGEEEVAKQLLLFDRRAERAGVLGAFGRAPNKADFIDRWVEGQTSSIESVFDLDTVEGIAAEMRTEVRRQKSERTADLRDLRREADKAIATLRDGHNAADFQKLRQSALALGDIDTVDELDTAREDLAYLREYAQLPPAEMRGAIDALVERGETAEGVTRRQAIRLRNMQAQYVKASQALASDPLGYASAVGVVGQVADISELSDDALRARQVQSETVAEQFGLPRAPFLRPGEAEFFVEQIDQAAPGEVVAELQRFRSALSDETVGTVATEIARGRPEVAVALGLSADAPMVARGIIAGRRQLGATPDIRPMKSDRIAVLEGKVRNLFEGVPEAAAALDGYLESADALYAFRRAQTGDLTFDADTYEQALDDAMGGLISFKDRVVLPPVPGMTGDQMEDLVTSLKVEDLVNFGNGTPMLGDTPFTPGFFDRGLFERDARLVSSGPGRYLVKLGNSFIGTAEGGAYSLDLGAFARQQVP